MLLLGFLQARRARALLCPGVQASHCGGFALPSSLLECSDFSSCSSRLQSTGSGAVVLEPGRPAACGIQTRDQTCVPCVGRQILNRWTTSKAPHCLFTAFILWVKTTDFPFKKLAVDHQGAYKFSGSFNFSPRILFFFDTIVNSTVFLILFWDCSLLMC